MHAMIRHLLAVAAVVACVAALSAQDGADSARPNTKTSAEDSAVRQAQLKRSFENFRTKLAVLAGRMEASSDPKERDKAKALRAALKEASDRAVENKFDVIIRSLNARGADQNPEVLAAVIRENKDLRDDLRRLIALLSQDDRDRVLKERREEALRLLETLKELRDKQARTQAQTELGRKDAKELGKDQKKVTDQTKDLKDKLDRPAKDEELAKKMNAVKRPVGEANGEQKNAEARLSMDDKDAAGDSQGRAVAKLDEAIREVTGLLDQTRQEEQERLLQDLLARAKKMRDVEKDILAGTEKGYREFGRQKDGKASLEQAAAVNKLAERQLDNLRDCDSTLKLIRDEGKAVSFEEVFLQVSQDMDNAQRRFGRVEVDAVTLATVTDVVETLEDVIRALQRAIQENQRDPNNNPPPPGGKRPPPQLVTQLQQLKMIRTLQQRVNSRTAMYGRHYDGEQVPEGATDRERVRYEGIQRELRDLAGRQERLARVTRDLGKESPMGQ